MSTEHTCLPHTERDTEAIERLDILLDKLLNSGYMPRRILATRHVLDSLIDERVTQAGRFHVQYRGIEVTPVSALHVGEQVTTWEVQIRDIPLTAGDKTA